MTGVPVGRRWPIALAWEGVDWHRWATVLAVIGTAGGVLLAWRGLPPVDLHGPPHYLGVMDPLCGATRSVRHTFRGELASAWRYNPIGPVLVAGAVGAWIRAVLGYLTGRWLTVRLRWTRPLIAVVLVALVLLAINQQLHADLLIAN